MVSCDSISGLKTVVKTCSFRKFQEKRKKRCLRDARIKKMMMIEKKMTARKIKLFGRNTSPPARLG